MAFASRPSSRADAAHDINAMQDLSSDASAPNTLYSETASTIRAREWTAYQASLAREQEQMYGLFGSSSSSSTADHAAFCQSARSDMDQLGHARRRTDSSDMGLAGPAGMGPDPAARMEAMYSAQEHTDHLYALAAERPHSPSSHTELVQDNEATIRQRAARTAGVISSIESWTAQNQLEPAINAQPTGSLATPAVTLSPAIDTEYHADERSAPPSPYDQTASDPAGLGYTLPSSSMLSDYTIRQLSPVTPAILFDARSLPDMPSASYRPATAVPTGSGSLEVQQEQQRFRRSSLPEGTIGGFEQAAGGPYLSVGEGYTAGTAAPSTYRDILSPALSSSSESPSRSPSRDEHDVPSSGVSSSASASGASATGGAQPLTPEQQYYAHYISYYTAQGYSPADAAIAASAAVEYYCGPSGSSYTAPVSVSMLQYSQAHPHIRGYSSSSSLSGNSGSPSAGYISGNAYYASPHTRSYTYGQHGTPATPATSYGQAGESPATCIVPASYGLGDITYDAATGRYLRQSPPLFALGRQDPAGAGSLAGEAGSMAIYDQCEDQGTSQAFDSSAYPNAGGSSQAMARSVSSPASRVGMTDASARGLVPLTPLTTEQHQQWYRIPQTVAGGAPNLGLGIYGTTSTSDTQYDSSSGPATATAGSFYGVSGSTLQVDSASPHLLQPGSAPPTSGEFRMSDYPFANPYAYSAQLPAGASARSSSTLRAGKKPSNGALARSTSLTSAAGGRVKRKKAPATAAPKSPRLSASAFRFHQMRGVAGDKLPPLGPLGTAAGSGSATSLELGSMNGLARQLAPTGRMTRARQKLAASPSTPDNAGLFQLPASASAPTTPYTGSTDAATGSGASKSVSPPAAGPYLGPINLISAFEPDEVYDANTPLHLLPTKRSRGRRPVGSSELDVDPSIASTTASTYSQLAFSGVTKTGRPKKIFVCRVPGCDRCFKRQEHLNRHIWSLHTNEKPWPCEYPGCKKTFARSDNLDQHIKNIHRDALKLTKRRLPKAKQEGDASSAEDYDRGDDEAVDDVESSNGSGSGKRAKPHNSSMAESSASPTGIDADMQDAEAQAGDPAVIQEAESTPADGRGYQPGSLHEYHPGQSHQHQQYAYALGAPLAISGGPAADE